MNTENFIKLYTPLVSLFNSSKELYIITSILSYQLNNQQFYKTKKAIAQEIAITDGAVQNIINKLAKQGYIIRETVSNYNGNKGGSKSFLTVNIDKIKEELEKRGVTSEQVEQPKANPIIKKETEQPKTYNSPTVINTDFSTVEEVIQPEQSKEEVTIENWEGENREKIIMFLFIGNKKEYELLKKIKMKYGYDNFDADDYDFDIIYSLETQGYLHYTSSTKKYEVTEKYNDEIKKMMVQSGVELKEEEVQEEEYTQAQLEWLNQSKENNFSTEEEYEEEDYGYNEDWEDSKESADDVLKLLKATKQY